LTVDLEALAERELAVAVLAHVHAVGIRVQSGHSRAVSFFNSQALFQLFFQAF